MGKKFLVDTNIVVYYLDRKIEAVYSNKIETFLLSEVNISIISSIELFSYSKITPDQINSYKTFLSTISLINISEEIAHKAAELRRNNRIKLPDAIIAATALIHDLELVTRNDKDFLSIPNLSVLNPFITV